MAYQNANSVTREQFLRASCDPDIGTWHDTHVRVTGPAVDAVQVAFLEDWMWATGTELRNLNWVPLPAESGADANVISFATGPADEVQTSTFFFLSAII